MLFSFLQTLEYFFRLTPSNFDIISRTYGRDELKFAVYDVPKFVQSGRVFNVAFTYNRKYQRKFIDPPVLHAHRFQTG